MQPRLKAITCELQPAAVASVMEVQAGSRWSNSLPPCVEELQLRGASYAAFAELTLPRISCLTLRVGWMAEQSHKPLRIGCADQT